MQNMIDGHWIDEFTRAVFVEFLIYNPNTNMYGVMLSVFEFTADGGVSFCAMSQFSFLSLEIEKFGSDH